jgi:hypothetical protein
MDPIESDGEASPCITEEVDSLIDIIETAGGSWHVIGGSRVIEPYLAFQLPTRCNLTDECADALSDFTEAFASNEEIRKATIEFAINVGAYYVEFGNDQPVVSDGRTVQ